MAQSSTELTTAFHEWSKERNKAVIPIQEKFLLWRQKHIERLQTLKKNEKDEVEKLKNRLKKVQSDDDSAEILNGVTDEWVELKNSRTLAVKEINKILSGGGESTTTKLKQEDNSLFQEILKRSYEFVENRLDSQRREIQQILKFNDKRIEKDKSNGSTEDRVLSAEIQEMQKVLNYRTAQEFCRIFTEENWKTIHSKYKECSYLKAEFEENLPSLKRYTVAGIKISCSMCTEIPKRVFLWEITAESFVRASGAALDKSALKNKHKRFILPAITSQNKSLVFRKGMVQLDSDIAADTENDKKTKCAENTDNNEYTADQNDRTTNSSDAEHKESVNQNNDTKMVKKSNNEKRNDDPQQRKNPEKPKVHKNQNLTKPSEKNAGNLDF